MVLHGLLILLSYIIQDHLPQGSNAHIGLDPARPIFNDENNTKAYQQVNIMRSLYQPRVELTKNLSPPPSFLSNILILKEDKK